MIDIIIVGSGASGAAAAWSLSNSKLKIVCLEQGNFLKPEFYPSTTIRWEIEKFNKYNPSPNIRGLENDYPINDKDSPIGIANYNAVGGSTILYSGHFPRLHPSDFKAKTLDSIADDWPINYSNLEPFYNLNDKMMGVSGISGDPCYPPINNLLPPIPLGRAGEKIAKGFKKLNWHIWPSYSAIITKQYMHREKCINLGPCNTGCPQGAKSSVDITYWPIALRNGVDLKVNCRVSKILTDDKDKVSGVLFFDKKGKEHILKSKIVILACNGVGTPRLLLNSKNKNFPNGLANSSSLVGKNLMLHPLGYVEGLFEENLDSYIGPQGCCFQSQEFYETDESRGFKKGFTMQILRGSGPYETAISGIARRTIDFGKNHHQKFNSYFGKNMGIGIIVEDLPELENKVTLDDNLKDSNGIPAPKINYKLSENSKRILSFGLQKGKEVMNSAGSIKNIAFGPVRNTGWHLMGTARMGKDSSNSVVNKYGESHDVKNLYIVDSSIFVTSGGVNPCSTLQALSLYISEHIKNLF